MEPTANNLGIFMFPTAICTRNPPSEEDPQSDSTWPDSFLNPKNRINSLAALRAPKWRIDGGSMTGTRFFTIPDFAHGKAPLRIDTYIPDINQQPGYLKDALHSNSSMFLENCHIGSSNIARHILRALEAWSEDWGWADFEDAYMSMPFGSRIMIENISIDIHDMKIHLAPYYAVEQQMLSVSALQAMWELPQGAWPDVLDLHQLHFVQQLYESISLVQISANDPCPYVFKSLTDDMKPFYHELKTLLTLAPHPNIIARPSYIIAKKCQFGGKTGICGFVLQYHPYGTLRTVMSQQPLYSTLHFKDRLRWATQITSALLHLNDSTHGPTFYTTLKPENVVMSPSSSNPAILNALLIDFEQRLGPPCWNPPEINYIAYIATLASTSSVLSMKQKYTALLESANLSSPHTKTSTTTRYDNSHYGPCNPWPTLSPAQREAAQVFALGKLLWVIFENGTLLNTAIGIHTFREDVSDIEFPDFRYTPVGQLRELVRRCTSGAEEWRGRKQPLVRRQKSIGVQGGTGGESIGDIQVAVRKWWREEIGDAEKFVGARAGGPGGDEVWGWAAERPRLREVLRVLEKLIDET
jgi:hypothetical protein